MIRTSRRTPSPSAWRGAGSRRKELDGVWFYEEPHVKFTRVLVSLLGDFPRSRKSFASAMKSWLGHKLWTKQEVSKALNVHPDSVEFLPHHLSHAYQAFLSSGFREAAVLTIDGVGEWTTTGLYRASMSPRLRIEPLECIPYPHSLGLAYAAFTAHLGFRPNDAECSTMALAAFGSPTYADAVRTLIRVQPDGTYLMEPGYFDFTSLERSLFTEKFTALFGPPRNFKDQLPFDALSDEDPAVGVNSAHRRHADVAASIQLVLEEAILALAGRLHRLTGSENLCFAGGVALNSVAESRPARAVALPPCLHPARSRRLRRVDRRGALRVLQARGLARPPDDQPVPRPGLRRGAGCPDARGDRPGRLAGASAPGCAGITREQLHVERCRGVDDLVPRVVDDLLTGRIVGWLQGRFEIGPRAGQSVDPGRPGPPRERAADAAVGQEPGGVPAVRALSVAEEDAYRVLEIQGPIPQAARWMQMVVRVRDDVAGQVRGAIHIDRTTRPQVCSAAENPRFHRLLAEFGRRRGVAALLNTSFNEDGYPLVSTPAEALLVFARTDMETLVINDLLIRKRKP